MPLESDREGGLRSNTNSLAPFGKGGDHNVAALHEAIAAAIPDRDCIVAGEHRLSWADVTDRSRRLADVLHQAGLGIRAGERALERWESPHDHVALYLYNSPEYMEGMLGAWKARCAPININYRYVAAELTYVLRDSRASAIVVGGHFADTLAEVLSEVPDMGLILQVDDGSGAPLLPGALPYEEALAKAEPRLPFPTDELDPDDRYILYTGGTTGMPKGVLWRQGDFLATCLGVKGDQERLVAAAQDRSGLRSLPAAPLMHGAAHWNAISTWTSGGCNVLPSDAKRFDPADVLATCERERVSALQIVGDAFARPLLDEIHAGDYDLSRLHILLSGGATLSAPIKAGLVEAIPALRIIDVLGSSETGRQAVGDATTTTFAPSKTAAVLSEDRSHLVLPDSDEICWLAQRGRVPLGYLGDRDKTLTTFPIVEGVRFAVAGDHVRWGNEGQIEFLGRDSVTINTGGEKVYAEEVEQALTSHPAVADALVCGRPHERWGQEVVAVVQLRSDADAPLADETLKAHCRQSVAGYKVPRAIVWVDEVRRSPSGKPDYVWARAQFA